MKLSHVMAEYIITTQMLTFITQYINPWATGTPLGGSTQCWCWL